MTILDLRKKYIYILVVIGLCLAGTYLSLYANNFAEKKIEKDINKNINIRNDINAVIKTDNIVLNRVKEKKFEKQIKQKTKVKQIRFTAKQNKRFLNLSKKARNKLKKDGIDIFIKLPKKYYHCNNFGCFLKYDKISKSKKKHFLVKMINSKTKEQKSTVYIINYNIKDKGFDITSKLKIHTIQNKALSCESSSAADIISYLTNSSIAEEDVLEKIKGKGIWFNKEPEIDERTGKRYWGDPNVGFVGYIDDFEREIEDNEDELIFESDLSELDDILALEEEYKEKFEKETKRIKATQHDMTGYGVYEKPLISVYNSYNLNAKIINKYSYKKMGLNTKSHLTKLLIELKKGNMVQLWGDYCTLEEYEDGKIDEKDVRDKEGILEKGIISAKNTCNQSSEDRQLEWYIRKNGKDELFTGLSGEHNFYLLGYEGNINRPTSIIVWDTYTGRHIYPTKEWYRKWGLMQNRSIIVSKK